MGERPAVAVIVPFSGSDAGLKRLRRRLAQLRRGPLDELIISDNRDHPVKTPAYARNRAAGLTSAEWLVFIDADTAPEADLLDAYFDPPPDPLTAVLAGGIRDHAPSQAGVVARHAIARAQMSHNATLARSGTPYAQTANCAVRRSAFEAVGGFEESARAGEDADLCFRLVRAGCKLEQREAAVVAHESRQSLRAWLAQLMVHGSGAAWLDRRWPGEFPRQPALSLLKRLARHAVDATRALVRGDWEIAAFACLDLLGACAFGLGRLFPNRRRGRDREDARMRP
jgi:mycofactocin glycosyltransferase